MLKLNELHVHGKMTVKFSSLKKKLGGGGGCLRAVIGPYPAALSFLFSRFEDKPHDWLFFNMQVRLKKIIKKQ